MLSTARLSHNFKLNSLNLLGKYFASKQLLFGTAARRKMLEGSNALADAV
jgi:hypothetical protein